MSIVDTAEGTLLTNNEYIKAAVLKGIELLIASFLVSDNVTDP